MLKRMIGKLWLIGRDHHYNEDNVKESILTKAAWPQPVNGITLNFTNCDGGILISLNKHDERTGNYVQKLYIVHDDVDLGAKVSEILSFNSLQS